jgi:hypothetical protein
LGLHPSLHLQDLLLSKAGLVFAPTAFFLLLLQALEPLLLEEGGLLLALLLHPDDMQGQAVIAVTVVFGKADEAFYRHRGLGGPRFWIDLRLGLAWRIRITQW